MAKYPKYYVRPDGLHETIIRINGKRKAFRGKTDREVWEKVKAFDRAAAEAEAKQEAIEATTFASLADNGGTRSSRRSSTTPPKTTAPPSSGQKTSSATARSRRSPRR